MNALNRSGISLVSLMNDLRNPQFLSGQSPPAAPLAPVSILLFFFRPEDFYPSKIVYMITSYILIEPHAYQPTLLLLSLLACRSENE